MAARALKAYINGRSVGELRDENGIWSFTYDAKWNADPAGYPLSPALPRQETAIIDGGSSRPVQWYFDNLLPEEGARQLLAKDAKLDAADAFGLLSAYGAESAGSLTLVSGTLPREGGERPLPYADLQTRIEKLPRVPLAHGAAKKMSLAGAQHKLAMVLRGEELFEPMGSTPSTHILKPDNVDPDYPHTVANEYFTMRLAGALKVGVPGTLRRYVPSPIYVVERFDRKTKGEETERLHLIDACQALNLDRQFKYREGAVERLRELAGKCTPAAVARINLFRWLVFNMLVGNSDAHLKNISFLVDATGLRLAPFYDLLAVGVYGTQTFGKKEWPHIPLAFPVEEATTFDEVSRGTLIEAGKSLGLRADTAARILDDVTGRIDPAARSLLAEIEDENRSLSAGPAGQMLGGELRCLRAIIEIVIRDSVLKLTKLEPLK